MDSEGRVESWFFNNMAYTHSMVPSVTGEGGISPPRPLPSPGPRILRGSDCDQS